jgi:hypothetical protein
MELNSRCLYLLENFHDANVENIQIIQSQFSKECPSFYPKDSFSIILKISLPALKEHMFSEKLLNIYFYDISLFKIEKNKVWNWLIDCSKIVDDNMFVNFYIDDYMFIQCKRIEYDVAS